MNMRDETDELLNDILSQWWSWHSDNVAAVGFYTSNPACKSYRASRQRDDENGALDSDLHNFRMQGIDDCIEQMQQPWRTAVEMNARNLATGVTVWMSPRLPADSLERAHLLMHARAKLLILLERGGVA